MARSGARALAAALALCLLTGGLCFPHAQPHKRATDTDEQKTESEISSNAIDSNSGNAEAAASINDVVAPVPYDSDDDDDDDDFEPMYTSSSGGGSNIFSLLRIAGAILPSSSNANIILRNIIQQMIKLNQPRRIRRQLIGDNEILFDFVSDLRPPPLEKQEVDTDENNDDSKSESSESDDNGAEESVEEQNGSNAKDDSDTSDASVGDNDSDYDSDEPPGGGDGQGGGILGLLAGLSGGEDGQSDLGSLLATVSGIVANLSGDGIDLNALIASAIGLFVGLLSEGEENPGAILASYLLTSLDTITGGGSKNNGAFFGTFLSKLVKGTSAVQDANDAPSAFYTLKLDILRALVQFGTTLAGLASSSVFSSSG